MAFWESAGFGGAAGGAGGIIGAGISAAASANEAKKARKFQQRVLKNRYQWMVGDLRKAGINPIMAASLGAGGAPGGVAASMPDFGGAMARGIQSGVGAAKAGDEKRLLKQQSKVGEKQADLLSKQAVTELAKADQAIATAADARQRVNESIQRMRLTARENPFQLPEYLDTRSYLEGGAGQAAEGGNTVIEMLQDAWKDLKSGAALGRYGIEANRRYRRGRD